ncbi:MAG TPA: protein-L-isoaspartate(D-aspartate) O-methyltransferase [Candidatus Latescibacteria bacterium]|nr:protein-L-isoaspartate(D-aspartate) O-methyltransferase [Candidatus Latescibacterota bacterium]HQI75225.1 protein-L-isoaspartate(D-aspartate) O-methyltransferase [Candidatus Latescibacterota bacterium]
MGSRYVIPQNPGWSRLEGPATVLQRNHMVDQQICGRGIRDARVVEAMRVLPRHLFVPPERCSDAYDDHPLPIGCGQTISQPYIVALMLELLETTGKERVLEIGTGSGYQTGLLALLCHHVYTVERHQELSDSARQILSDLGFRNITFHCGDGSLGWEDYAPFDRIIVSAATPSLSTQLVNQLDEGGVLVAPVGDRWEQSLKAVHKRSGKTKSTDHGPCVFVPLIGNGGFPSNAG